MPRRIRHRGDIGAVRVDEIDAAGGIESVASVTISGVIPMLGHGQPVDEADPRRPLSADDQPNAAALRNRGEADAERDVRAIVPPIERSMPRVMITKVCPSANTARMVDWMNRFLKFAIVRKTGETNVITADEDQDDEGKAGRPTMVQIWAGRGARGVWWWT